MSEALGRRESLAAAGRREFAEDVCRDLNLSPRQLQSRYLYDALGSCLFEAICQLPWYGITRAELALLRAHASSIVSALADPITLLELGCGSGGKIVVLGEALQRAGRAARVHLIDVSPHALAASERELGRFAHVSVVGHQSTYQDGLRRAAGDRGAGGTMLVLLLGSNIGNFDPPAAGRFLGQIRASLRPGDALLLGADLVKPEADLLRAYDDPLGVTAAFNKNLLVRINRELGAGFDVDAFDHRAVWNPQHARVEMHLVSRRAQTVRLPAAGCTVSFRAGEWIWTESSYKYTPAGVVDMGRAAGFDCRDLWVEPEAGFALALLAAA